MKNYLVILAILVAVGSINTSRKGSYNYTIPENHKLYIEVYQPGAAGNAKSAYLTDSTDFKISLGTFDEKKEDIDCKFTGDIVDVEKREHGVNREGHITTIVKKEIYSIKSLKQLHNFQ